MLTIFFNIEERDTEKNKESNKPALRQKEKQKDRKLSQKYEKREKKREDEYIDLCSLWSCPHLMILIIKNRKRKNKKISIHIYQNLPCEM